MANKQYLIELAVKDTKLKSSLKKALENSDIQKQLGILGEGITEHLEKDVDKAASILGKVDWASLLGTKDFEHLQQLVAKTVSANKDLIKSFVKSNDVKGIQDTIELVSALGSELKAINPDMTVAGLARSMASFIKVVEPLTSKLNEASSGAQNFQNIMNNFDTSTINKQIREVAEAARGMITSLNTKAALGALEKGIQEVYGETVKLQDVMLNSDAIDAYLAKFTTAKAITEEMTRLMNEAKRGVHKEPIDRVIFKQYMEGLQSKLTPLMPALDGSAITKEVKTIATDVEAVLKKVEDKIEESFNKTIEKKLGSIKVTVDVPTEDKLIADINAVIEKVNVKGTNSLKLVGAESAIKEAQKKILDDTQEWHNKMKDALKFSKKEDIELDLGVKLRDIGSNVGEDLRRSIEEYFDNPSNKVAVPVELILTGENKAIIEGGGGNITINGGVGSGEITAESLAKALTTPIEAKIQEEQQKQKPSGKLISLNPGEVFSNEVIEVFDQIFDAIERGGENAKKISEFFRLKGLDLSTLKGKGEMDILSAFESFLERGDKSVLDDVETRLIKGSTKNKATLAFADLLRDSIFRFDLDNITTKEDVKRRQVRALVEEDYIPRSKAQESLYKIRNTDAKDYKLPTVEELNTLMTVLPNTWGKLGEDFLPALESLKQLRSTITDPTNATEIKRFQEAADEFALNTNSLYREMSDFMHGYKIGVFNKGHNKHNNYFDYSVNGGVFSGSKLAYNLDKVDYFELYDDPSGHFSRGNRKDAMDNASRHDRYQLKRDSRNAYYRTREPERTSVLAEDVEIAKFEPKDRVNEELQEINKAKEAAEKRSRAMEEARKSSVEEEKKAEELREQELATDKKRRTALKSQRTKNTNKLKESEASGLNDEVTALRIKNEQLDKEITELDEKIAKNSVEPTKSPTVFQQLKELPKADEVQSMIDEVNTIDVKIDDAQKKAIELEKFVNENLKAEKKANVGYTKSETNNQNKNATQNNRLATLGQILDDKDRTKLSSLTGLTKKDRDVAAKLLSDRKLYQLINSENGLGLPINSRLEDIAKERVRIYQEGLNKVDEFLLKHQGQTIKYVKDDSDLTQFMKDDNTRKVLAGTFKGSKEDEASIRTKISEFKARMVEAGKSYVADYINMWSDKNLRELMKKDGVDTRTMTDAKGDSILQEFYRRIVDGGISKRDEAYKYLRTESAKYQKNIQKDEGALEKIVVSTWEQTEVTDVKNQEATERVKEKYKEYVNQWLYTIQENMYNVLFGELDDKDAALKLKKNDELRGMIGSLSKEYLKNFGEILLTEDQSRLLKGSELEYTNFLKNDVKSLTSERDAKQTNIEATILQKAELLRQRRAELLNKISDGTNKGKDTASFEKALLEVEDELVKYSDQLPYLVREEFEADLLNAKNATEEEWKKFKDNATNRRNEFDSAKYTELKGKQTFLLGEIKQKAQNGESTYDLVKQLEAINKEIVQYEVNTSRLKEIEFAKFPNDASVSAIRMYNSEMQTLVELQQKRALLEANGESAVIVDRDIAKQKRRLKNRIGSQIEEDKRIAAEYAPANQAAEYIKATDKALYILKEQVDKADDNLETARRNLATMQGDEYKNSRIYTSRIDALKNQDVSEYVRSDKYRADRQKGVEQADKEFSTYLTEQLGEDVAQRIVYEFAQNGDRANVDDILDGSGNTTRLAENAFTNAMTEARKNYMDSDAYKELLAEYKAGREKQIEAELAGEKEKTDVKVQEIWNATKADIERLRNADMANSEELRTAVFAEAGMGDSSEYRRSIVNQVREDLIQQRIEAGRQEQKIYNEQYYAKARQRRSELSPAMYKEIDKKVEQVVYDTVMSKIKSLVGDNADLLKGLEAKRNEIIEANVGGIVEQYRNSLAMTETGMYKGVNVREMIEKELANEVAYYEQKYIESSGKLGMLKNERARAESFGKLGYDETLNPEIVQVRANAEARLSAEKEKQVELTERLTNLTAQNADQKLVQSVAAELQETEKEIIRLQLLADGASEALSLRKTVREEEFEENKWTPEKQRLWYIDAIEREKAKLESGTDKQKTEAANHIAKWEQKLADIEKVIEASKPEAEKPKTVLDMITNAIRQGLAGVTAGGTVDLDASLYNVATETTLQEILRLLGGNGAVEYANQLKKELAKDRPRYERRNSEGGNARSGRSSGKKTRVNNDLDKLNADGQRIYGELEAEAKVFTNKLKENGKKYATDFDFVKAIKAQAAVVKKQTKGSLEYIQEQTKLTVLYQDYYNKTFGKGKRKSGQPAQSKWAEQGELGKIDGLKDLLLFKSKRADALANLYGVVGATNQEEAVSANKPKKSKKKNSKSTQPIEQEQSATASNIDEAKVAEEISKAIGNVADSGIEIDEKEAAELAEMVKLAVAEAMKNDGLGRDTKNFVKTEVKDGVKEGVAESSKTPTSDKKLPYDIAPDSLIGRLQNTVGGDTGALAKQATLALVLSELQAINKKVPTIGKAGVKSSAQNLLEEFQKMAAGSAMDSKERVSYFDLVNGAMSPSLSGATHSIPQKLLDTLSQQYGVDKGYRSQVHTHADSKQTWFSSKDLDHFKKNLGDFGVDSIKQQVLLTKDNITVFDMTMVETAEKAALAIDILKKAGSNIDNDTLEQLSELGARYNSKNLNTIGAKGLMDILGVKNYQNDSKQKNTSVNPEAALAGLDGYAKSDADKRSSKYVFNSFDGETLKYQLIDAEGNISKVILAWDELENKVRVVSDTSTSSVDATVKKIQQYKTEIQSAKKELLLSKGDDTGFVAAEKTVDRLVKKIESGSLSGDALSKAINQLETARQNLANEGAKLHKLINQNNKLRGGTAEVKQAITQGTRVRSLVGDAIETNEQDGLQLFSVGDDTPKYLREYVAEYNNLIEAQQRYIKDGSINSAKIQDNLKVQTAGVKKLGIEAMAAYKNTQRLQEQSDASKVLTYTDAIGKTHELGGSIDVGNQEVSRSTMAQYAKEVLGADLASVKFNATTGKLTGVLKKNNYVVADMAVEYDKATGKLHLYQEKERESLSGIPGFLNGLKAKSKAIIQYVASMTSIYRVLGELRKGIQYIREIDLALTELKKVTNETDETYDKFLQTAAKTGARLGSTISAVTEATATFAKLGYTMEQASEMAESAIVYKNVGDNIASTEDAANSIISTLKGFGMEASESMAIVDKFNEVGNNFAITSQGIGEALRLSASALSEGKNSLDESIAMITAANEVVNDPSSVGTALKTLTLRLRGSKTELEEMGEDVSDMATTTSQLQAKLLALTGGKVDIMLDENTFKNTTQILREMAAAWEDMDDISRASALELMGGKRQANTLSALIQNFDTVEDVIETSAKSAGSALRENEHYLDSIQGKIDQFNNATQALWSNFLDADTVKFFVDIGTQLVKWVDNIGLIKALIMSIGTFLIQKHFKGDLIGGLFGDSTSINAIKKQVTDLEEAYTRAKEKFSATGSTEDRKAMEDAEANLNAFKKHNQPALDLDAQKTALNEQLENLETEKEQLLGDLQTAQDDLIDITTNGIQEDVKNFVEIDTSHIDDQIAGVQERLDIARQQLADAESANWDDYKALGSMTPAKDRDNRVDKKKQDVKDLEAELDSLKAKKDEFMSSEIDNVISDGARAQVDDLTNKIDETEKAIQKTKLELQNVETQANATGNAGLKASEKIKVGFKSAGKAIWKFGKEMLKSMAWTMAITAVFEVIGNIGSALAPLFEQLDNSYESMQEKLSELQNELSSVKSELSALESELESTDDRIEELMSQGSLTFVEQEELNKLKSVSAELKSQIALQETLQKSLQQSVNSTSVQVTNAYLDTSFMSEQSKSERQEKGGEIGAGVGQIVGTGLGALGFLTGNPMIGAALMAVGSTIGETIGKWIGEGVVGEVYDSEQSVGEAMDDMLAQREKLKKNQSDALASGDAKAYNEATEALANYDKQMAAHISQIQQNYNAMDWDTATTEQRNQMIEYADWLDAYNISMSTDGAKSNAIARIFGDEATGNIAKARDEIDKLKKNLTEAKKKGEGIEDALAALDEFELNLSDEEVARLREMGIYLYEIEDYFKDVVETESEFVDNDLEDVARDINKITDGLDSLKTAFDEVIEDGVLTSKTVLSIKEALGIGVDDTKELTSAWNEYLKVMMSGTAATEEMVAATEKLTQAWIEDALANNDLTPEIKMEYIAQLRSLGVENADEYINDLLQKNMVKEIENKISYDESALADRFKEENLESMGFSKMQAIYANLTEDEKKALAIKYDLLDVSEDEISSLVERYGVEEDAIDAVIQKLLEKETLENDIANLQEEKTSYENWRNGDGVNKGILALKEDLKEYDQLEKEYNSFSKKVKEFNSSDWHSTKQGTVYVNNKTGEQISDTAYRNRSNNAQKYKKWMRQNQEQYDQYVALKKQYATLWNEGVEKGYIIDGEIVNPDFQTEIDKLNGDLEGIITEIDKELTVDVQLKLDLQNKSELVDDIQSIFDTLSDAQKEYDETGYVSIDTLQALLQLEPKYLDLLVDEEGNLNLTKDALYSVARARIIDMGIQSQKNILEKANALASEGSSDALREQIEVMQNANDVGADFVEVEMAKIQAILAEKVAAGELTQAEADTFISGTMNQIEAIQVATQSALDNLNNSLSTSNNTTKQETEDAFKKAMDYWDNRIDANQAKYDQIQNDIDWLESQGKMADANYYKDQIALLTEGEESKTAFLNSKLAEAEARMRELEVAGQEGSEEWWEAASIYNDTLSELDDVRDTVLELQDAIGEIEWSAFEEFNSRLDDITSKLETMRDLIAPDGEEDWFDDEGNWTEKGVAVLGTYVQELEYYKNGLNQASDALDDFNEKSSYEGNEQWYADNYGVHSEQEYYDYLQKLTDEQYKYAQSVSDTEQDIADMYESSIDAAEEYIETLVDSYNDYIDSVKEALDAERD